jgi:hypothetical protein
MVAKEMVRLLSVATSPYPSRGGVKRYRANLLSSTPDPILAAIDMRPSESLPFEKVSNG